MGRYKETDKIDIVAIYGRTKKGRFKVGSRSIARNVLLGRLSTAEVIHPDSINDVKTLIEDYGIIILNYDEQSIIGIEPTIRGTNEYGEVRGTYIIRNNVDLYFSILDAYRSFYYINEIDLSASSFTKVVSEVECSKPITFFHRHNICILDLSNSNVRTKFINLDKFKSIIDEALLKDNSVLNNIIAFNAVNLSRIAFNEDENSVCLESVNNDLISFRLSDESFNKAYNALRVS